MTTDTDWITEGAKVAIHNAAAMGASVRFTTISRLTATQVVLDNGDRYNRKTLRKVGGSAYHWTNLLPADHPKVQETVAANRKSRALLTVQDIAKQLRHKDDAVTLSLLDQLDEAVRAARAAFTATA